MDKQLGQLEQIVLAETQAHERLLTLLNSKLSAMREADHHGLAACCQQENQQVQLIGDLAKQRMALVAQLTQALHPSATEPLHLNELAQRLPEPVRGRLLVLGQQLKQRINQVRQESGVARRAAEALLAHMQGLVQSIGGAITGIGVYSRRGAPPKAALAVSTFNTTA